MRRLLVLLPVVAVLGAPAAAGATWSATTTGSAGIGARSMVNATALTAACGNRSKNSPVDLTWTASTDPLVNGYEITRIDTATGIRTTLPLVVGVATVTAADAPLTGIGISYTYEIRAASTAILWKAAALGAAQQIAYDKTSCTAVPVTP